MFKIKYYPDRSVERYNARLIIQNFLQIYNLNYINTFALIIKQEFLKIFQATIATILKIMLLQILVISVYLKNFFS